MSFLYHRSNNSGGPDNLELVLLNDSQTFNVGDVVQTFVVGYGANPTAATPVLGVINTITDKNGQPIVKGSPTAGSQNTSNTKTVTTAADNTTTLAVWAQVDTSDSKIYSAEVNGTIGTTVDSELRGARLDVDAANTNYGRLLETTATRTVGTAAQFYSHGVDPDDPTRLLVSIALSEGDSVQA